MIDSLTTPQECTRGFAAQYASVFATLCAYLEVRTSDTDENIRNDLRGFLRERGPLPTYSEYRRKRACIVTFPDGQTRERVLLDGAVRGINARVAAGLLFTDDEEATVLHAYVGALVAFIRGEGAFPGFLPLSRVQPWP